MPRGMKATPTVETPIDWRIAGAEAELERLRKEQRHRFAQIAVKAALYLHERGHRQTGETMEAHFGNTCQCFAAAEGGRGREHD